MALFDLRKLLARIAVGFVALQFGAVASLIGWSKLRRILRRSQQSPLLAAEPAQVVIPSGTKLTVYTSGALLYDDMIASINAARDHVFLESFIIKADEVGQRFADALNAAAARGVDVRVVYDGFANLVVRPSFFLLGPNVKVLRFPVFSKWPFSRRGLGRDHRKLLVVDNEVGYVGGYNIGSLYATQWRDTHLRIEGPGVWELHNVFADFWNTFAHKDLVAWLPRPAWDPHLRAHRNVPRQLVFPIRGMYLEAIDRAQRTIDITQAYFIPDQDILDALISARSRGVRVRLLVPKVSNHIVADFLARGHFNQLLDAGVEIWRYSNHMVHAKTATIDEEWTTIGTANIDRLSLTGNYEINIEVIDARLARVMVDVFERDLARSERLTPQMWQSRPRVARLYERVLAPLRPIL